MMTEGGAALDPPPQPAGRTNPLTGSRKIPPALVMFRLSLEQAANYRQTYTSPVLSKNSSSWLRPVSDDDDTILHPGFPSDFPI